MVLTKLKTLSNICILCKLDMNMTVSLLYCMEIQKNYKTLRMHIYKNILLHVSNTVHKDMLVSTVFFSYSN